MKRLRHVAFTAQRGREHIREDEQQATPIYDIIAQSVNRWNLLGLIQYNDLAYEDEILSLLARLPDAQNLESVEHLIFQAFADQPVAPELAPNQVLAMQFLAYEIWELWNQYAQRSQQSPFSQARARARMRRFYYPNSR